MSSLTIKIGNLKLSNPVMNASGTLGFGIGGARVNHIEKIGAVITKTITTKPRKGNPLPSIIKIEGGMMNSVGLANVGIDNFIKEEFSKYLSFGPPVIVSIAGESIDDFVSLTKELNSLDKVNAIELNTSCPNVHGGNIPFGTDEVVIAKLIGAVRKATDKTLIVKLTPNVGKIEPLVISAEGAGADAISLINTILGLEIDIDSKKPVLGGITGGISGPAIRNHALLRVFQASKVTKLPIIGMGGISDYRDALKFIMAGATCVAVGTANYSNPGVMSNIVDELNTYLISNNLKSLDQIRSIL